MSKATKRVTLDLSDAFYRRLEELQAIVDADSKASVIRDALQLYEYIAKRTARGDRFQAVSSEGESESLVLLNLNPPL